MTTDKPNDILNDDESYEYEPNSKGEYPTECEVVSDDCTLYSTKYILAKTKIYAFHYVISSEFRMVGSEDVKIVQKGAKLDILNGELVTFDLNDKDTEPSSQLSCRLCRYNGEMYWATNEAGKVKYLYTPKAKDNLMEIIEGKDGYNIKPLDEIKKGDILKPKTWDTTTYINTDMRYSVHLKKKSVSVLLTSPNDDYIVQEDKVREGNDGLKSNYLVKCKKKDTDISLLLKIKETVRISPNKVETEEYVNCYRQNEVSAGGRRMSKNKNNKCRGRRRPQSQRQIKS